MKLADRAAGISPSPTLAIDAKAKQMKAAGIDVINFGVGEPEFDTPEHIKAAAVEALQKGMTKYTPASGTLALKEAVVKKLKEDNGLDYETANIVINCGAKHSLYNTFQVLCQTGDEVILPAPYWVSYVEQIKMTGATPVIIKAEAQNGFKITPEQLKAAITPKTKVFLLNSPSNPTGAVYNKAELQALGEILVKHKIAIISDEIYEKLVYDGNQHISIASLSPELKDLTIVINGVSKAYAMTGWRIGYLAAPAPVAKAISSLQSHSTSNPASVSQAASIAALTGDQTPLAEMHQAFTERRQYILDRIAAIPGLECAAPGGAFYVFPRMTAYIGKSYQGTVINGADDLAALLLEKANVALVPGIAFGDNTCFRMSYATSKENIKAGLDRLEAFLAEVK
ncbi:MAG: pyridoxal phosphate-dependent aminotransferase [Clostridia bacterium]|nr:pyridoxal phosphate-dependent aminotransferase [Clostridia bacterium]